MARSRQGIYGNMELIPSPPKKTRQGRSKIQNSPRPLAMENEKSTEDKENNPKERFDALFSCVNRKKSRI